MVCLLFIMRNAIRRSRQIRYRITKGAEMWQIHMSLLMSRGCGLSMESLDLLVNHLELGASVLPRFGQRGVRERRP